MKEWSTYYIILGFEFEHPEYVSIGLEWDELNIMVLKPELFFSEESRQLIPENFVIKGKFPPQLPPNITEQAHVQLVETIKTSVEAVVIGDFMMTQVLFDGVLYEFWVLFYVLQIICYLEIYDVPLSANAEIF